MPEQLITTDRLTKIAEAIAELPLLDVDDAGFQEQGEQIARLCGNYTVFTMLDERPGALAAPYHDYRSEEAGLWHIKLRRARNGCSRFFDLLGGFGS